MKKKILLITAVWGRHELTAIVLDYYRRIKESGIVDLQLLAVGSEGEVSRKLCEDNGWNYIEFPNDPLSLKWNALAKESQKYEWDMVVITGSDDLISEEVFVYYSNYYDRDRMDMLGLSDIYFHFTYQPEGKQTYYFNGYGAQGIIKTLGAGRCFSRAIFERCNWRPWKNYRINRALDTHCSTYLRRFGIREVPVKMETMGCAAVDIKIAGENITSFHKLQDILTPSNENILFAAFPRQMEKVKALTLKKEIV